MKYGFFHTLLGFFFWGEGGEVKPRNALTMNFTDSRKEMWRVQIEWEMCNIKQMQIEVHLCP